MQCVLFNHFLFIIVLEEKLTGSWLPIPFHSAHKGLHPPTLLHSTALLSHWVAQNRCKQSDWLRREKKKERSLPLL